MSGFKYSHARIVFPDGCVAILAVPVIAKSYATYYSRHPGETFEDVYEEAKVVFNDEYEIEDWLLGNMEVEDFEDEAQWFDRKEGFTYKLSDATEVTYLPE